MTEEEIQQLQSVVAQLQVDKANLQNQVDSLTAEKTALTSQVAQLQSDAEEQGSRLTTALDTVAGLETERATYTAVNTRLRQLIAGGVSAVPDAKGMAVEALTEIQASVTAHLEALFNTKKTELSQ